MLSWKVTVTVDGNPPKITTGLLNKVGAIGIAQSQLSSLMFASQADPSNATVKVESYETPGMLGGRVPLPPRRRP